MRLVNCVVATWICAWAPVLSQVVAAQTVLITGATAGESGWNSPRNKPPDPGRVIATHHRSTTPPEPAELAAKYQNVRGPRMVMEEFVGNVKASQQKRVALSYLPRPHININIINMIGEVFSEERGEES